MPYASTLALVSWGLVSYEWLVFMNTTYWNLTCKASTPDISLETMKYLLLNLLRFIDEPPCRLNSNIWGIPTQIVWITKSKAPTLTAIQWIKDPSVLSNALQRVTKRRRNHQTDPDIPKPEVTTACLAPMATMHNGRRLWTRVYWVMLLFGLGCLKQW